MAPDFSRRDAARIALLGTALTASAMTVGGCSRPPPSVAELRLATGPAGAVYREIGAAFVQLWNDAWGATVVRTVPTEASVDNLALLLDGEVDLGFVNADVAADQAHRLTALLRVFDSVLHVVVPGTGPGSVAGLADLRDRRVTVGLPGSGTRFVVDRLLATAGVRVDGVGIGQQAAARAMALQQVDAVMSLAAMPTPAVQWLMSRPHGGYRFVDLSAEVPRMHRRHRGEYLDVTISGIVYPGVQTTATLGVASLLCARPELADEVAEMLTRTVVDGASALVAARPEARQINARTAIATTPVALHPGAAAWFRRIKP